MVAIKMNINRQMDSVEVIAHEVLSLHEQELSLIQRANEVRKKAEEARTLLSDLITSIQESTPHALPGLFTINGLLFDITRKDGYIEIHKVSDLINHLEAIPTS